MIDKISSNDLRSERLTENNFQEVKNFNSFERELVDFLLKDALKNQEMHISTTHLWFYKPSNELAGYITLLTDRISLLPAQKEIFKKKGVNYKSLPALKIGRLCVHDKFLRKGIGTHMVDALILLIQDLNKKAGCRFIVLDAKRNQDKSKDAVHFYKTLGFEVYKSREKGTISMYKDVYQLI